MALAPGDVLTQPDKKIVFNAPFTEKNVYSVRLTNNGAHRIGWAIKTTNMKRIAVDPPCGVLDAKVRSPTVTPPPPTPTFTLQEGVMLSIACEAFDFGAENTNNDRISFEWTNAPEGAAKQFRREWFQGDGMVRRKNLPIEYNP